MQQNKQSSIVYFLLIIGIISLIVYAFSGERGSTELMSINELAESIQAHRVKNLTIDGDQVTVRFNDTRNIARTYIESNTTLLEQLSLLGVDAPDLSSKNIEIEVKQPSPWMTALSLLISFLYF